MPERERVVPYNDIYFSEWCDWYGFDDSAFRALSFSGFRIARERSKELSAKFQFLQEVEASLPLEGSALVDDFRLKPDATSRPKFYKAPDGMAYEMTTHMDFYPEDEWDERVEEPPVRRTYTFVGEYLHIDAYAGRGTPWAEITVRESPTFYAVKEYNPGFTTFAGPQEEDMIRLPSRYDPEKPGAYIAFDHYDDWEIMRSGDKMEGNYGDVQVKLVPYEKQEDTELYKADFNKYNDRLKLDSFLFIDEKPLLPNGWARSGPHGDRDLRFNAVCTLVLPPIPQNLWTDLWYKYGIYIKLNPTVYENRFVFLDFDRPDLVDFQVRRYNSGQKSGRMFMRSLVVRDGIGKTGLKDVVKAVSSNQELTEKEIDDYHQYGL